MVKRFLHLCVSIWLPYLELGWQARQDVSEKTQPHQNIWGKQQNSIAIYVLRERLMEAPTLCVLAQKPKTLIPAYIPNAHSHSQLQNVLTKGRGSPQMLLDHKLTFTFQDEIPRVTALHFQI